MNVPRKSAAAGRLVLAATLSCFTAGSAAQAEDPASDPPGQSEVADQRSFDPGPELQRVPGGSLIVNAFIMDGPVRVDIHNRHSDALLMTREGDSMFPFEVAREDLAVEPEDVRVRIYVKGNLSHTLELER